MKRDLLRQLAAFHAVGADGTIAAAARRLGKSPPAVHHDIARLEQNLGEKLFRKSGRYLQLTPASRQLHVDIGRSLDKLERDLDRFGRASQEDRAWRIGVVAGFGRYRLAPLLFSRATNRLIELVTGSHDDILCRVMDGTIEVGVTYRPVVATPIQCEYLADEQIVLVGPPATPLVGPSLEAIRQLDFVTYDEYEYVFGTWFDAVFKAQPSRLRRSDHATELEEALESVANGRGVTITPADAWQSGPWRDRCVSLVARPVVQNPLFLLSTGETTEARDLIRDLFRSPSP